MNEVITIVLTIIVFVGVIALFYILAYNNLQAYKIKINEAESIIDELLRTKYDLLLQLKKIITNKTDVEAKIFDDLRNLKSQNISSFDFERKLSEFNIIINQIKGDFSALEKNESFNKTFEEIYSINEKLTAAKAFYNKYTSYLNKLIKNFPSNLIARLHHISLHTYFDGKDLYDQTTEDFKI